MVCGQFQTTELKNRRMVIIVLETGNESRDLAHSVFLLPSRSCVCV